jgi:uncharacterized protein YjbI with pentapeptide repeats
MKNPEVWHPDDRYMDSFGAMLDAALNMPVRNEANPHRVNPTVVDLRRANLSDANLTQADSLGRTSTGRTSNGQTLALLT